MPSNEQKIPRPAKTSVQESERVEDAMASVGSANKDSAQTEASSAGSFAGNAFAAGAQQMPELVRSLAEQGLDQSREVYNRMRSAAEEATGTLQESFGSARDGMRDVQVKALDAAKANTDATFDFMRRLVAATSMSDAVQLQASFVRERFEALVDYSKDVQGALSKAGSEAARPAKELFERTTGSGKSD